MKQINVKYNAVDKVWIVNGKCVNEVTIAKIRIEQFKPFDSDDDKYSELDKKYNKEGYSIQYLLPIKEEVMSGDNSKIEYKWFYPEEIYDSSDEAIKHI